MIVSMEVSCPACATVDVIRMVRDEPIGDPDHPIVRMHEFFRNAAGITAEYQFSNTGHKHIKCKKCGRFILATLIVTAQDEIDEEDENGRNTNG